MFSALVRLGRRLEAEGRLPDPGFYYYKEPVKWIVHLWEDRVYLEAASLECPRPFSGRTSDVQAHLLSDEAGYALGVSRDKGGTDRRSGEKHKAFCALLEDFREWKGLKDPDLKDALVWLEAALDEGRVQRDPRFSEVLTKDWVSFVPETGPLRGEHLFEHGRAKAFWLEELRTRSSPGEKAEKRQVRGECAVCGREALLVGRIPVGVKLVGNTPLHSINADAFTSFVSGTGAFKKSHIGLCFECGDTASRAFNYLSGSERHRRTLVYDSQKRDSLANQIALFWLKVPAPVKIADRVVDLSDIESIDFAVALAGSVNKSPSTTVSQLLDLLRLPWSPVDASLRLDDYGFFLAVLSPNIGRIALREWLTVSIAVVKKNLARFLEASRIVSTRGEPPQPLSIGTMLQALESKNPNLSRELLRTAYLGYDPPQGLWTAAVNRFRSPNVLQDPREAWRLRALAGALKLGFNYREEEVDMSELNVCHKSPAYLCGRLLSVLEEAQQRASGFSLNKTLVDRFYGAASTAPAATLGGLIRAATTAHLPKVGGDINVLMEGVMSDIDSAGGFPRTLTLSQQAEFGLGFYHQRAAFRAKREKKNEGGNQ